MQPRKISQPLRLFLVLLWLALVGSARASGGLTFIEAKFDSVGLDRAETVAVSPDGQHLYVAGQDADAVTVFSRNGTTGRLTFVERQKDGEGGVDGLDAASGVIVSPDGRHVYVTSGSVLGGDNAVAVFSRNETTGSLSFVEVHKDGVGGVDGLQFASSVTITPDGQHLYVTGPGENAVAVFSRNSTSGALSFIEVHKDGVAGVNGLSFASAVTVSPDGQHVYVASQFDGAVAVFSRNSTSGALSFVEAHKDGEGGVDDLFQANAVTVSPDGHHVYVASAGDNALVVFSRNETSGATCFIQLHIQLVGFVDVFLLAKSVTVSLDEQHVYVAGRLDHAVVVFSRNETSGKLNFIQAHKDETNGVDGLAGASAVLVSPDGQHVYVTSQFDDAVAVFGVLDNNIYLPLILSPSIPVPPVTQVYWTDVIDNDIQVGNLDGSGMPTRLFTEADGLDGPFGLTVDSTNQKIYWATVRSKKIQVGNLDGSGTPTDLFTQADGLNALYDLALDLTNQKIYWANVGNHKIQVGNLDGSGPPTDLFTAADGLNTPTGIALDLTNQKIYWTDDDQTPAENNGNKIQVGNLDGSGTPTDLFTDADGLNDPQDIALDLTNQKIYWADRGTRKIQMGNLDGSGPPTDLFTASDGLEGPQALALDLTNQKIYWADGLTRKIQVGNLDGSGTPTDLFTQTDGLIVPIRLVLR